MLRRHGRRGSRGTLVGSAEGQRPFARRRPGRREMSEGARVQARTPCRMPPHQPAGIAGRAVSPQRRFHKGDVRCLPRFLMESASGGKGLGPLDPGCRGTLGLRWHSRYRPRLPITPTSSPCAPASPTGPARRNASRRHQLLYLLKLRSASPGSFLALNAPCLIYKGVHLRLNVPLHRVRHPVNEHTPSR